MKRNAGGALGGDKDKPPVTEVLLIGKRVEDKDAKGEEDKYFARLEKDRSVVKVAAKNVEPLVKAAETPEILRNRNLVEVETGKVDAVNVKNGIPGSR